MIMQQTHLIFLGNSELRSQSSSGTSTSRPLSLISNKCPRWHSSSGEHLIVESLSGNSESVANHVSYTRSGSIIQCLWNETTN